MTGRRVKCSCWTFRYRIPCSETAAVACLYCGRPMPTGSYAVELVDATCRDEINESYASPFCCHVCAESYGRKHGYTVNPDYSPMAHGADMVGLS